MKKPTILISNDDGVQAEGILSLARALTSLGKVFIVAPAEDQSTTSHSMHLHRPLRVSHQPPIETEHGPIEIYAVNGTPTDAVYIAAHHILANDRPELVISGINNGPNLGNDVFYSGTVSAAMEGVFLGIPAVAISSFGTPHAHFARASQFASHLCAALLQDPLPKGTLLNVNIPKEIKHSGFAITTLGQHEYTREVEKRLDPRGKPYYWIGGIWRGYHDLPGTDCRAIAQGYISVTPIELQLTSKRLLPWVSHLKMSEPFKPISFYEEEAKREEQFPLDQKFNKVL